MRLRHSIALGSMLVALPGFNGTASGQATAEEKAVMQAIDRMNLAYQQRDVKAYEDLTTADFVRVTPNGRVFPRTEWLKAVAAPGGERPAPQFDQVSVRVYGDGAIVTYRATPASTANQPAPFSFLTRVMVKQGTQWMLAFAQSTDAQPPAAPTGPEPPALPAWSPTTTAEREALAAFQAIQKANRERDVPGWEKLSAPDHTIIGSDGQRTSRAERVAELRAAATAAATPAEQDLRVAVKGDLAIITWTDGTARSLKILARRGGAWQQVLQQFSPIVAAKAG